MGRRVGMLVGVGSGVEVCSKASVNVGKLKSFASRGEGVASLEV